MLLLMTVLCPGQHFCDIRMPTKIPNTRAETIATTRATANVFSEYMGMVDAVTAAVSVTTTKNKYHLLRSLIKVDAIHLHCFSWDLRCHCSRMNLC